MKTITLTIFSILLLVTLSVAQEWTHYNVRNTTTELLDNKVLVVAEDINGNVWVGTPEGVSKYDGTMWVSFDVTDGLVNNSVSAIACDPDGNMWFGTANGVSKFDGSLWTNYTGYPFNWGEILCIAIDIDGKPWFATPNGAIKYIDGNYWDTYNEINKLTDNYVSSIVCDPSGTVWFATGNGITKLQNNTWTKYFNQPGFAGGQVFSIAIDHDGSKWFGVNQGLVRYDDIEFKTYKINGFGIENIYAIAIDQEGNKLLRYGYDKVIRFATNFTQTLINEDLSHVTNCQTILVDSHNNMWFGTYYYGVIKYDNSNTTYYCANGLSSNMIRSIIPDPDGSIWILPEDEKWVCRFDGEKWYNFAKDPIYELLKFGTLLFDRDGSKWFTLGHKVVRYDGVSWTTIYDGTHWPNDTIFYCAVIDPSGNKWYGSNNGIFRFNGNEWERYNTSDGLFTNDVRHLAVDAAGNIWAGYNMSAVSIFNGNTWTTHSQSNGFYPILICDIQIDAEDNKWFLNSIGYTKYDGTTIENLKIGIRDDLVCDAEGIQWFLSVWKGFYKLKDSELILNDYLKDIRTYSLSLDAAGNKWFCTDQGIWKYSDGGAGPIKPQHTLKGTVFNDSNGNGIKDNYEAFLPGQIVETNGTFITSTNNGMFYLTMPEGQHTVRYIAQPHWQPTTDTIQTITITGYSTSDTIYFGVKALDNITDVSISLTGSPTRLGFTSQYWIDYKNKGTITQHGQVSFDFDPKISFISSKPQADIISGNTLSWNFSDLLSQQQRHILVTTSIPVNNTLGDTLKAKAGIYIRNTDIYPADNYDSLYQIITGSYDPNDKSVSPAGEGDENKVLLRQELTYTIRFQNTGTDTAFSVQIRDTLSSYLNPGSLRILASSSPVTFKLDGKNKLTFKFTNINLPDSNVNEPGSHGFVKYAIKPIASIAENSIVTNEAYIFFDYNPAILTNQVQNTFVESLSEHGSQSIASSVSPNPFRTSTDISFENLYDHPFILTVMDVHGRTVLKASDISSTSFRLDGKSLGPGLYIYQLKDSINGKTGKGKLIRVGE